MTDLEKELVDALRPFTFRLVQRHNKIERDDPWSNDPTKMTEVIICDSDVIKARKAVGLFDIAERKGK